MKLIRGQGSWWVLLILLGGCNSVGQTEESGGQVIAEVEGFQLTAQVYEELLKTLPETTRTNLLQPEHRERFIRQWMEMVVLSLEAQKLELDQDPAYRIRLEMRRQESLADAMKDKIQKETEVSDVEVKAYYEANRESFKHPPMVKLNRILVGSREEAQEIAELLRSGGDFGELARNRSKDLRSRDQDGVLGWIAPNQLEPALDQVAFGAEVDAISDPVRSVQGWHVLKVSEKLAAGYWEVDKVADQIRQQLAQQKKNDALRQRTDELVERYGLVIHDPEA